MAFTLYDATIPSWLQLLESMRRLVGKAEAHGSAEGWAPEEILEARLAPDMLPFAYQVKSTAVHSLGAIEGVRRGSFAPDQTPTPTSFAALVERLDGAIAGLQAIDPAEIEGFLGRDMCFRFGEHRMDFTAENFLLSFSQPNFYFHAATAYDILRWKGLAIGKRDFNGRVRKKG